MALKSKNRYKAVMSAYWVGNVTFPLEAHYGATGYVHDDLTFDVRQPGVGMLIEVLPQGGGGM